MGRDEDMLGHCNLRELLLAQQQKSGHLNGAVSHGKRFVATLQKFLRRHGYLP